MNRLQFGIYKQEGEKYYEKGKNYCSFYKWFVIAGWM